MQKMERPELDEEANRRAAYWLLLNAKEQGFFSFGLLSQTAWEQVVESQGAIEVESSEAKQVNRDSLRSEERRVGKECSLLCRSRWSPYH